MGADTRIEWADHTFNPWIGCTKVSPACDHCYAETLATARLGVAWGPHAERRRTKPSTWNLPLRWNRQAEREGRRFRVFCASLADVFDNAVPAHWRGDLWQIIHETPHLDWLLLTKRPQNIAARLPDAGRHGVPAWGAGWPNVWLGTTVENQAEADRRIPHLLSVQAAKRFLSMEPLLGPVDLRKWLDPWTCADCEFHGCEDDCGSDGCGECGEHDAFSQGDECKRCGADVEAARPSCPRCGSHRSFMRDYGFKFDAGRKLLDWIITGGESGPKARPSHPDWFRSLRDQCRAAGVPFFMKQMWGRTKATMPPIPDDLMIREIPHA